LAIASLLKARLLSRLLDAPVSGWRWPLVLAAAAAALVGYAATFLPEWTELVIGIPLILATFGAIIWKRGFTHEDRVLFKMRKGEEATLPPPPGASPPGR
jgi:ribose/xylose/arabinose/galactoside ABC-type transport system permease subunit